MNRTRLVPLVIPILINMWITSCAFAWGELGHRIIAADAAELVDTAVLANCHVTGAQLVDHVNDPDKVWRQQRWQHPHEAEAHYFHVDRQPADWRARTMAQDATQGYLVYRIVDWAQQAKALRRDGKWNALAEKLYGLAHYLGDLTQPLHLNHDYDGREAGLPDIHSQFESKMLNRFEEQVRAGVKSRLSQEKIPVLWASIDFKALIFDTAQQSGAKAQRLFDGARPALMMPKASSKRRKHGRFKNTEPRFEKKRLYAGTGALAEDQLALAARLFAFALNSVCK